MNKQEEALDNLLSHPDGRVFLSSFTELGGYASELYNKLKVEISILYDKEFETYFDEDKNEIRQRCILILSKEKIKKLPEYHNYTKQQKISLEQLNQRISLDEYKYHLEELSKLGIDGTVYIFEKLIERHQKEQSEKQLKISFK